MLAVTTPSRGACGIRGVYEYTTLSVLSVIYYIDWSSYCEYLFGGSSRDGDGGGRGSGGSWLWRCSGTC